MTITSMIRRRQIGERDNALPRLRCDVCGTTVTNPEAHLSACVDHEVALFSIGRAS